MATFTDTSIPAEVDSMNCVSDIACIEFPSYIACSIDLIEPFWVVDGEQIETRWHWNRARRMTWITCIKSGFRRRICFTCSSILHRACSGCHCETV